MIVRTVFTVLIFNLMQNAHCALKLCNVEYSSAHMLTQKFTLFTMKDNCMDKLR